MRYLLLLTTLFVMVACDASDPVPSLPDATPLPPTSIPATAPPDVSPTEGMAEPTVAATQAATPTTEAAPAAPEVAAATECDHPVYSDFLATWESASADCPTRDAEVGDGAHQPFANGQMIWTSESDEEPAFIYVLNDDNTWQKFEDLWREGDLGDAGLTPPAQRVEPHRGFGLLWREQLGGPDAEIGWALEGERGREVVVQEFDDDTVIGVNNKVYWLSADGTWQ